MKNLFEYVGKVLEGDTFDAAINKIREGLQKRTNKVVQRNMMFTDFPQGNKSFERWSQEISTAAQLMLTTGSKRQSMPYYSKPQAPNSGNVHFKRTLHMMP